MKVTIACLNSKYIHMSSAPWCLAAGVAAFAETAVTAKVMESTINADLDAFAEEIIAQKPDVLSFCCYIWNVTQTLGVAKAVKTAIGCTVVLGGPEVAYRPRDVLDRYPFVDYVLAGEGEFSFPAFLDMLNTHGDKEAVKGLSYRRDGEVITLPEACYCQTPPSPFTEAYFNALGGRICYIESSRGCPYRCAFCLSGRVSPLRFFDIKQVKADLLKLANSGTRTVKFVDRTFNAKESHCNEILSFIKENYGRAIPAGVCFHFEMAGDILKESTLSLLSQMPKGAVQLEIGMQSFNEQTLAAVNRKTDTQKLQENIRKLLSFGNMHVHIDLIAGLTGEDLASFEKSFDTGYSLGAHMLQMGFLKLLHGADMREKGEEYPCAFSDEPPYEVTSTPWLTEEEIRALKNCEAALDRMYNSGRFLLTLEYLIKEVGLSPFRLFFKFGGACPEADKHPGRYAEEIYRYFAPLCDREILRETLVSDLLYCGSAVQMPDSLKLRDPLYKRAKARLCHGKNVKVAILRHSGKILAVDYHGAKDFFGRLEGAYYDISLFENDNSTNGM